MKQYETNEFKFSQIGKKYSLISDASFYSTHIKIAAKCWVDYLNESSDDAEIINTGHQSSETFAIKLNGKFVVNEKFVNRCIKNAHDKNSFLQFGFMKVNITLDILDETLARRN